MLTINDIDIGDEVLAIVTGSGCGLGGQTKRFVKVIAKDIPNHAVKVKVECFGLAYDKKSQIRTGWIPVSNIERIQNKKS
jgi:hypothetical protein